MTSERDVRSTASAPERSLLSVFPAGLIALLLLAPLAAPGSPAAKPSGGQGTALTRARSFSAGPNLRIRPGPVTQTEPFIVRHPLNDSILFVAANTINFSTGFISEGIYGSSDGGSSWYGSDTCTGAPIQFHRGDPGIAIDRDGTFILTRLGFSPGLYSHFSTDRGTTWSAQKQVASNDQDRADVATDGDPASPRFGTTYASWVRFASPYPVFVSATTDGGAVWGTPVQVNNPSQRSQGTNIAVGRNGLLYLCWAGVTSTSPFTEDIVGFARSTDGGSGWSVTENAFDINGIAGALSQKANIRVNGLPRMAVDLSGGPWDGRIYIVTTERNILPAGADPDVIIRSSSDSGKSWSAPVRVNQDAPDNGRIQYFPAIHVDDFGGVNILYYSDEPTTSDSSAIFLARSTDGGATWGAGEIGDHRFRPEPIGGLGSGYQGDNISLGSSGDTLRPVWTDNSTGIYQLWTSPVWLPPDPLPADEPAVVPSDFRLGQNYPNPFNPSTVIRFALPRAEQVSVTVYDLLGNLVATLVSGRLPAGEHEVRFSVEGGRIGSGIYFCRMESPTFRQVRKMLYIR